MNPPTFSSTTAAGASVISAPGTNTGHGVRRWFVSTVVGLTMGTMFLGFAMATAEQPDPKRFTAQALALRTAAIERTDAATRILARISGRRLGCLWPTRL